MESIDIIALCMVFLSVLSAILILVAIALGVRVMGALKRLEGLMDVVKTESLPILSETRKITENLRDVSVMVRHQATKSEALVENTLKNVSEMSTRLRDSIQGVTAIFIAMGKIAKMFGGK